MTASHGPARVDERRARIAIALRDRRSRRW